MKFQFLFFILVVLSAYSCSEKMSLPEPVTNQASAVLQKNNSPVIYTFFGLDNTKKWSGVHNKVFSLDLKSGKSSTIGHVPDPHGRLAACASVIKNQAYVVRGYAVFGNGKEKSSKYLFIFNPATETFTKGADLPVPIDDQIQAVWRDSLLYVISGWYDSTNVRTVQVYNASINQWNLATPLPDDKEAAVFGGSGTIVGDTIYMLGGAMFDKFYPPSQNYFKGVINPKNPLEITWINAGKFPGEFRYRSAAFSKANVIYFFGGSNETYNYSGISYQEQKPVEPNNTVLVYNILTGRLMNKPASSRVMDLRNIVRAGNDKFYLVGGMGAGQQVRAEIEEAKPD